MDGHGGAFEVFQHQHQGSVAHGLRNLVEGQARGLSPSFGCRGGSCGTCKTRVLEGEVTYAAEPSFPLEAGEALICCALPAQGMQGTGALQLAL